MIQFQESYPYKEEVLNRIQISMNVIKEPNMINDLELSILATFNALGFSIPQN